MLSVCLQFLEVETKILLFPLQVFALEDDLASLSSPRNQLCLTLSLLVSALLLLVILLRVLRAVPGFRTLITLFVFGGYEGRL